MGTAAPIPIGRGAKPRLRGVSHLYATFGALVAGVALVASAPAGRATFAASVYAVTLVTMFAVSALYHRGRWTPAAVRRWLKADHTAIFLFIAGTYTPIALLTLHGTSRVLALAAAWAGAALGTAFEWTPIAAPRGYVTTVYLVVGWVGAFTFVELWQRLGALGALLIAGGGVCYTAGALALAARRPDPWPATFGYHEVFHALVIVGAVMHYCTIAFIVLPRA